jgi:hypothetical protein
MASKKKTDEEPVITQEEPETDPEDSGTTSEENGVDMEDTPLGNVEGDLVVVRAPGGLNLREGPSTRFRVLEPLPDGALISVLELPYGVEVPGWALVHTGSRAGWVDIRFIQELEPDPEV